MFRRSRAQLKPTIDLRPLSYTTSILLLSAQVAQSIWAVKMPSSAASPQGLEGLGVQTVGRSELLVVLASSVLGRML